MQTLVRSPSLYRPLPQIDPTHLSSVVVLRVSGGEPFTGGVTFEQRER